MPEEGKYITDADRKLQEMACSNWPQFVQLVGERHITSAKICILRNNGKSYGQIAVKLNVTSRTVEGRVKNCNCN